MITAVIVIGLITLIIWYMSKREEKKLLAEVVAHTHREIAESYTLWDKFFNYYSEKGEEMTVERFDELSVDEKTQMVADLYRDKIV